MLKKKYLFDFEEESVTPLSNKTFNLTIKGYWFRHVIAIL